MRCPSSNHKPWRGMVIAQATLCLTVVMGIAALALDGGLLLAERQRAQAVADAAALAAAVDYNNGSSGTAKQTASNVASANNYTLNTSNVKIPGDASLHHSGSTFYTDSTGHVKTGYVEVTVSYSQPAYF